MLWMSDYADGAWPLYQDGDVAQLVERQTGTPLRQLRFHVVARDFFPESPFSADSATVSIHPHVQSHALTSVHRIKIL